MSYTRNTVFTDVVKDIIGDEPVLDQFDIDYKALFFGSVMDDYITGSMVVYDDTNKVLPLNGSVYRNIQPSGTGRGSILSKTAWLFQPSNSEPGTSTINVSPYESTRVTPVQTLKSSQFRTFTMIDERERFYDSCLPSLKSSLAADGTSFWTIYDVSPFLWLSPVANTVYDKIGYIRFNDINLQHIGNFPAGRDPLTNNSWTWSYPYETRYNPDLRFANTEEIFDVGSTNLATTWFPIPFQKVNTAAGTIQLKGFLPLFSGRFSQDALGSGGVNGLRNSEFLPTGSAVDSMYGTGYIIPADVDFSKITSGMEHQTGSAPVVDLMKALYGFGDNNCVGYVYSDLLQEASSSAYYKDFSGSFGTRAYNIASSTDAGTGSIKWNNSSQVNPWTVLQRDGTSLKPSGITYSYLSSSVYWSSRSDSVLASDTDTSLYGGLSAGKHSTFSLDVTSSNPWCFAYKRYVASDTSNYLEVYINRARTESIDVANVKIPIDSVQPGDGGAYGPGGSSAPPRILQPFTSSYYPPGEYKINVSYVRDVQALSFSGFAAGALNVLSAFEEMADTLKNKNAINSNTNKYDVVGPNRVASVGSAKDSLIKTPGAFSSPSLLSDINKKAQQQQKTSVNANSALIGAAKTIGSSTPTLIPAAILGNTAELVLGSKSTVDTIDRAFISEINIITWDAMSSSDVFSKKTAVRIGGNNYPTFRRVAVDTRATLDSLFPGTPEQKLKSSRLYSSYNFGIKPVIRGWKYGLYSGMPMNSKAVFRRDHYGHLRDMLEQRPYTKFYYEQKTRVAGSGVPPAPATYPTNGEEKPGDLSLPAVSVRFVKRRYKLLGTASNIGEMYNVEVDPELTLSHNLSTEATSSIPYFDNISRERDESSYAKSRDASVVVAKYDFDLSSGLVIK